jgi:hypothetical protein
VVTNNDVVAAILGNIAAAVECEYEGNWPVTPELVLKKIDKLEAQVRYEGKAK